MRILYPDMMKPSITVEGANTERTLTAAAGSSPRDPYRHALAMRPPRKVRPFSFFNYLGGPSTGAGGACSVIFAYYAFSYENDIFEWLVTVVVERVYARPMTQIIGNISSQPPKTAPRWPLWITLASRLQGAPWTLELVYPDLLI